MHHNGPFPHRMRTWPLDQPAQVAGCHGGPNELLEQLLELGFVPGTPVRMEQQFHSPVSPIIVWIGGSKLILGPQEADLIYLEAMPLCKP